MDLDLYINSLKGYLETNRGIDTFYFIVEDAYYEKVANEAYENGYEVIHVKEATTKSYSTILFRRIRDLHYWMDKCTKLQQELEISSQEFLNLKHSVGYFISEATREITSGNASHKCPSIRGMANRSAEYLEKHKKYYSHIKWQTGEPKEEGLYIVTTDECEIGLASFHIGFSPDIEFFKIRVTAWCKLSDIEPYKEEKK